MKSRRLTLSTSFGALRGLLFGLASPTTPALPLPLPLPPWGTYFCPKLLEYRFPCIRGLPAMLVVVGLADDPSPGDGRPEPRPDGTNVGDGRKGVTGDDGGKLVRPVAVGEAGAREDVGDCAGRPGREGPPRPPVASGEGCRRDGEGECKEGEPEDMVEDLKTGTEVMGVRRMGTPVGESCSK